MLLEGRAFQAALESGPVQDPASDSDSQPLFATAQPDSGASFSCTVAARMAMSG
jgi:hypothetical protein